jgi:hypothetical protein
MRSGAGYKAGLPLALNMIVTKHSAHEVDEMRAIAERLELPFAEYVNMVPTIYGGAETLPSQSVAHVRKRKVFTGCNAGHLYRKAKAPLATYCQHRERKEDA